MRAREQLGLYDDCGARKYLTPTERRRFLDVVADAEPMTRALCRLLVFTGCRVSEALSLTPAQLDAETGRVILRSLKRRRRHFRAVPIPHELMAELVGLTPDNRADERIWGWCRETAWRKVKACMKAAGVVGIHGSPKGLRHSFGIANAANNVPPSLTQRWMGHADLQTTAIYQQAVEAEERAFAARLW